jgi:hypothetical protein
VKNWKQFYIGMEKLFIFIEAYHPSGFGVCCPGGRGDFKPDYRMSGFGAK